MKGNYPFPRSEQELQTLWNASRATEPGMLDGLWTVRILTGPIPNFSWAGHCKEFSRAAGDEPAYGNNRVLAFIRFGWFRVEKPEAPGDFLVLNYSRGKKPDLILGPMRDRLRMIDTDVHLGAYYLVKKGKEEYQGWFSLERRT